MKNTFYYRVDMAAGNVDWNRDGQFSPAGSTVRAYANYRPYDFGGCEFTREGEVQVGTKSDSSPAVIRYNGMVWLFTVNLNHELEYTYTTSPWTCPNVDDCPAPAFPYHVLRNIGPVVGVDAAAINVNGAWVIIVVGIRPDGTIFETWMRMAGWLIVWESTVTVPASPAAGEPSLAVSQDGRSVALAYRGTDNFVRYRTRTAATWRPEEQNRRDGPAARDAPERIAGTCVHGTANRDCGGTGTHGGRGRGHEWLDPALYAGRLPAAGVDEAGDSVRRDVLPHRPPGDGVDGHRAGQCTGDRRGCCIHDVHDRGPLLHRLPRIQPAGCRRHEPEPDAVGDVLRRHQRYLSASALARTFDNVWSYAFGIDLLQPGEVGLRAAVTYSIPNAGSHPDSLYQVSFRPHADGISDLPYSNKNDWPVIAWGACAVLAAQQLSPMKATCASRPW